MIGRRGFLGAAVAAPALAKKAVEAAMDEVSGVNAVSAMDFGEPFKRNEEEIALERKLGSMRDYLSAMQDAKYHAQNEFAKERIERMKSWGLPMREHVFVQDRIAKIERSVVRKRPWEMSQDELMSAAMKAGWGKLMGVR